MRLHCLFILLLFANGLGTVGSQQVKGKLVKGTTTTRASTNNANVGSKKKKKKKNVTKYSSKVTKGGRKNNKALPNHTNTTTTSKVSSKTIKSLPSQQQQQQQQHDETPLEQQQQQQRLLQEAKLLEQQQQKEEQLAAATAAANEQIRLQRERAFEIELARMTLEQQKAAQRQKKKDARIVRRVLRASSQQRLYQVLGIHNHEITIPAMTLQLFKKWKLWNMGPYNLFHVSSKTINRAYRNRALQVHPDKNRDGRAEEAFVAVNQAATILLDSKLRHVYDQDQQQIQSARRHQQMQIIKSVIHRIVGIFKKTIAAMRKVLGPFFLPFVILGALLI